MKYKFIYLIFILFFLFGCNESRTRKFTLGEIVCFKGGGPKGVVDKYISGDALFVGFYIKPESINTQIGTGGNILGGNGIVNSSNNFFVQNFYEYQLLHEIDCFDR